MSQDHKKVGEGDVGLNTGGMGAYAPTRLVTPEMLEEYEESIVRPTLAGLKAEGIEFRGTLRWIDADERRPQSVGVQRAFR